MAQTQIAAQALHLTDSMHTPYNIIACSPRYTALTQLRLSGRCADLYQCLSQTMQVSDPYKGSCVTMCLCTADCNQAALERHGLSYTYLAHQELESAVVVMMIITTAGCKEDTT